MAQASAADQTRATINSEKLQKFDFMYSFRPLYYISRIFGYMPFSIVCDSNDSIKGPKIRLFDSIWFIIAMSVYISSAIMILQNVEYPEIQSNIVMTVLKSSDHLVLAFMLIFGAVIIVMDMLNRFKLVDILKDINTFDEEVGKLYKKMTRFYLNFKFFYYSLCTQAVEIGICFNYKKHRRWFCLFCVMLNSIPLIIIVSLYDEYSFRKASFSTADIVFYGACCLLLSFVTNQIPIVFMVFLYNLNIRFAALNTILRLVI